MKQFGDYIHRHHRQIVILIVLLPLLLVGLYLALNPTIFRPKASGASLKLDPSSIVAKPTEDFVVSLILDPGGQGVLAFDVEVKYDPTYLEITSENITTVGFPTTALKKVDAQKGVITLGLAVDAANPSPLTSTTTVAALPFKAKIAGATTVLLGKSQAINATGQNILENSFSQVSITIDADQGAVSTGVPQAIYTFEPSIPIPGQSFKVKIKSLLGEVERAALIVNGTAVPVIKEGEDTYAWINGNLGPNLQAGKHILQLAGGCADITTSPNCENATTGFNPFQLNLIDPSATPARNASPARSAASAADWHSDAGGPIPAASTNPSENATIQEIIANWGKSGSGDVNNDGVVDGRDFVIVLNK